MPTFPPVPLAEKRERFKALAQLDHVETARQFEEEYAQLDLFALVKEKQGRRGSRNRKAPQAGAP